MSILRKTLMGMVLIFLLNLLILVGYYRFYLRGEVAGNLQNTQAQLDNTAGLAVALLEKGGTADIGTVLASEEFSKFDFTVTDALSGEPVYESHSHTGDLALRFTETARVGGRLLLVEATRYYSLGAVRALSLVQQAITVEIVIIALLLVLIAAVLQTGLIRPLAALNRRMKDYGQGNPPGAPVRPRQDELGQLACEFDRLTRALDNEKRVQEQIIASISHDIKTPLTSVMGYVERLLKGNVTDEDRVRRYLQTIYDRARSIGDLVADFDGYLASRTQTLKFAPLSASYLCGLIREEYTDELAAGCAVLTVENSAGERAFSGDLGKLRRVFGNLIGNAVKHAAPEGPLEISLRCLRVNDTLRFTVSDNGTGAVSEDLERIFEPFCTGDAARGDGSGLGLAICRSIVEAHGGTIRAESSEHGGLAVVVSLPAT